MDLGRFIVLFFQYFCRFENFENKNQGEDKMTVYYELRDMPLGKVPM